MFWIAENLCGSMTVFWDRWIAEERWCVSICVFQLLAIADDRFGSLVIPEIEPSSIPAIFSDPVFHDR